MAYTNFAAQLEALRNGIPSAEVFAGGMAGSMSTPAAGQSFGSNQNNYYGSLGIDQNANPFQGQLDRAFPGGTSPFLNYDQQMTNATKPGSTGVRGNTHMVLDPATGQMVPAPGTYNPGSGGGAGGGGAAPPTAASGLGGGYGMGSNPFQGAQADAIRQGSVDLFGQLNNQIRSNSVGVGGLGGGRMGVAQAGAAGEAQKAYMGGVANLYGSNWNADQNRDLSRYGMDQGFYTANRGLDQSGAALGANMMGLANNGDWSGLNQANGIYSPWSGFGNSTNSSQSGGGALGGLGGALAGFGFAGQNGWWK
jgi:hypothetical protein